MEPAGVSAVAKLDSTLRRRRRWRTWENVQGRGGLSGVRKALLPTNLAVNCLFLYLNPAAVHLCRYGPHAQQLLKLRGNGGTTTTTVAPVPSDTPEPSPSSFKHSLISLKREGWWGEAGLRIASLPSSEQQRVPLVGKRLPSDTAAVAGELQQNLHCWEVTTVGKGGSCGDNGGHATPRSRDVCSEGICHRYHLSVGRFLSGDIFSVRLISV